MTAKILVALILFSSAGCTQAWVDTYWKPDFTEEHPYSVCFGQSCPYHRMGIVPISAAISTEEKRIEKLNVKLKEVKKRLRRLKNKGGE